MRIKNIITRFSGFGFVTILILLFSASVHSTESAKQWKQHDRNRPHPTIIIPGTESNQLEAGQPPSDAIALFNGKDLSQWRGVDEKPAKWKIRNGFMECNPKATSIHTVQKFGDCQLHLEWSAPLPVKGEGQGRGNSGVYLMSLYEIQVLDSYENVTYADGQAAAIYGQFPPMVNACRPPGEWQSYDIVFHRPRFDHRGNVVKAARVTLFQNGVLVLDDVHLSGPTMNEILLPYQYHPDALPLLLQNHNNPVRYRNIWLRELPDPCQIDKVEDTVFNVATDVLDQYVGKYQVNNDWIITVARDGDHLNITNAQPPTIELSAQTDRAFYSKMSSISVRFATNKQGIVTGLRLFYDIGKTAGATKIE